MARRAAARRSTNASKLISAHPDLYSCQHTAARELDNNMLHACLYIELILAVPTIIRTTHAPTNNKKLALVARRAAARCSTNDGKLISVNPDSYLCKHTAARELDNNMLHTCLHI